MITREQDRDMILSPAKWPLLFLPLKRRSVGEGWPELGYLKAPLSVMKLKADEPVTISLGTIFDSSPRPQRTYQDVDALLDDGWVVD